MFSRKCSKYAQKYFGSLPFANTTLVLTSGHLCKRSKLACSCSILYVFPYHVGTNQGIARETYYLLGIHTFAS